jgi:predicted phosphate transport protein (TIGR00153 family)
MFFKLLPRDAVFFDLFEDLARRAVSAAEHLRQYARAYPEAGEHLQRIRDEEHEADQLAHTALNRLDRTFITPFDREDIHTLVQELDDIIDTIDGLAKRIPLFHVLAVEEGFLKQVDVLVQATVALSDAVHRLRKSRKLSELGDKLIAIHHSESVGDDNHHAALSRLFAGDADALHVMKWKELYDMVEDAIDGCEDVGNTLERIMLKSG